MTYDIVKNKNGITHIISLNKDEIDSLNNPETFFLFVIDDEKNIKVLIKKEE